MINQIFEKKLSLIELQKVANWCNDNRATLKDEGDYYLVVARPESTQEEINAEAQRRLTQVIQDHLDSKAQELNYDSCLSVCSYVDTGVEKFDKEGRAFREWRSAVWNKGYEILNACLAGEREIPNAEELIAELPQLNLETENQTESAS